ncbi:MAG TPA: MBL fold metallo-hydrolase [Myxococcus sp.]|nr:MBL fold metallo-hydrolase [Myxococcus sp.]
MMLKSRDSSFTLLGTLRLAALALVLTGCEGDPGTSGPQGPAGPQGDPGTSQTVDPNLAPLEKAFAGLGGRQALQALNHFTLQTSGARYAAGEGFLPESALRIANTYTATVTQDVRGDNLNIHYRRTLRFFGFDVPQEYSEIVRGNLGYLQGSDNFFGGPNGANMLSDRMAAVRKQQRLLNPHLLLREVAANGSLASDGGVALLDGSLHHLVVLQDSVHPITLYVNASTGRISRLSTVESDPLHRDVPVDVHYVGWLPVAGGPLFPSQVYLSLNGNVVHLESRQSVAVNGTLNPTLFDFPTGASPTYVAEDAVRGATSHQFHMVFSSVGVPNDGLQTQVTPEELAPGVFHLRGGSHHSMAIVQSNGIILVEAPLYQDRSEALLRWVKATFPDRPITHVISSHFHEDHSAGLRTFVPEGARIVVGAPSADFFRHIFQAPSTVRADALSRKPTPANLLTVPVGGSVRFEDSTRPVVAYHVANSHAGDLLMVYLPNERLLFSSDIYSPGLPPFPPGPAELHRAITETYRIQVSTIAGAHGGTGPFSDLATAAGQ